MLPQLLLNPEVREGVGRCLTEEHLHRLDFEKFHIVNEQFEGHLEGNILRRRTSWWLGNAWAEMCGALWEGHGAKIVCEQITRGEADSGKDGLGTTACKAMQEYLIPCRGDRQRGACIVVRGTADLPALTRLSSTPTALGNRFSPLGG